MDRYLSEGVLTGDFPLTAESEKRSPWDLYRRGYHDVTPPVEVIDVDDACSENLAAIDNNIEPLVAVLGCGYVGEHLVGRFSKTHNVIGYDVSETRTKHLATLFKDNDRVRFTTCAQDLAVATHFLISVPTLLLPDKTIDSSFLRSALATVALRARTGSVVVIESSVAVGMTRELLGPLAREKGFFAGMSPERVDPGRSFPPAHTIPKVVSGLNDLVPGSLNAIIRLYSVAFDNIVPVSRPEVAEMMKLYENCQRMIGIAYANEMADACLPHAIDPFEVCRAASTKPFGYMPFTPSLGVGGHCIPVNPYYLFSNNQFPLLQAASEKMRARPAMVAQRAVARLLSVDKARHVPPRVLVVGIGFKPGQSHIANSPGLELARSLLLTGKVTVTWTDPLVPQENVPQITRMDGNDWTTESLDRDFDMVIVAIRQVGIDFDVLQRLKKVLVEFWCT